MIVRNSENCDICIIYYDINYPSSQWRCQQNNLNMYRKVRVAPLVLQ
jgi:hypothetical protein